MNSPLLLRHPWIALLGWFPPAYLVGLARTWGSSDLFNRLRRDKARRLA